MTGDSAAGDSAKKPARPRVRLTVHERRWGPAVHASAIPGILLGLSFVGPLLVGRLRSDDSPFVRHQVVQAANFNLTVSLASLAGFLVMLFSTPGEPRAGAVAQPQWVPATALSFLILVLVYWFMFTIRAMVSTSHGEWYRYPPSLRVWHE